MAGTSAWGSAGAFCLGLGEGVGGPARVQLLWKPSADLWWMCMGERDQAGRGTTQRDHARPRVTEG